MDEEWGSVKLGQIRENKAHNPLTAASQGCVRFLFFFCSFHCKRNEHKEERKKNTTLYFFVSFPSLLSFLFISVVMKARTEMKERKKGSERSCVCFLLCPLHLGSVRASLTYPYNRTQSTKGKKKETHILPSQSLTPGSRSQLSSRYLLVCSLWSFFSFSFNTMDVRKRG